jgi:hypothetical protein
MSTASSIASAQPCFVYAAALEGGTQDLRASCKGRGLMLGSTTGYHVIANDALPATLIDTWRGSERRVLLISVQADGAPFVEDLSGQIALAAGRGPLSRVEGIELDLANFASDSHIGVHAAPESVDRAKVVTIDIGQQVAMERLRSGQ